MRITVTQEDIDNGEACKSCMCPVALALKKCEGIYDAVVGPEEIYIYDKDNNLTIYNTPLSVKDFMREFDGEKRVMPFTFELGNPL